MPASPGALPNVPAPFRLFLPGDHGSAAARISAACTAHCVVVRLALARADAGRPAVGTMETEEATYIFEP